MLSTLVKYSPIKFTPIKKTFNFGENFHRCSLVLEITRLRTKH